MLRQRKRPGWLWQAIGNSLRAVGERRHSICLARQIIGARQLRQAGRDNDIIVGRHVGANRSTFFTALRRRGIIKLARAPLGRLVAIVII